MITIHLEQSLHGYADGHRMLATSARLSPTSQRIVRTLSDLSGPRLVDGFEDYLTGYFLPGERLYAFARTWYFTEAQRPGCVWTHTLFLNRESLAAVESLDGLLPLFRRPPNSTTFDDYDNAISVTLEQHVEPLDDPTDQLERILTALYSVPLPVVVPVREADDLMMAQLAFWRHYKSLTGGTLNFCTGAIQPRRGTPVAFDCQSVPERSIREVLRGPDEVYVVDLIAGPISEWARAFVDDLPRGSSEEMRRLFDDYASFPRDDRGLVGRYADFLQRLPLEPCNASAFLTVVSDLQRAFPSRLEASRLKAAVAAGPNVRRFFVEAPDSEILHGLLTNGGEAFDPAALDIPSRLAQIWQSKPLAAVEIVTTALSLENAFGRALLDGFSDMCRSSDVAALSSMGASDLVKLTVSRSVSLAATPEIWKASDDVRRAALTAVTSQPEVSPDILDAVVSVQLETRADDMAAPMVERFGLLAAEAVLKWAISNRWYLLPQEWENAFENVGEPFVEWLNAVLRRTSEEAFAVPRFLTPRSRSLNAIKSDSWTSCLDANRDTSLDSYTSALFLVVLHAGLVRLEKDGERLVASSFPAVYYSARANTLNEHWWKYVEEDLVKRSWWDRCRTLRVGLVSKWVERNWATDSFIQAIPDADCLYEIFSMWGWSWEEKRFLGKVIRAILRKHIPQSERLVEVAMQCEDWF